MSRRTMTLADDAAAVEAQVVVERAGETTRIVEVHLRATGGQGLRADDLLMLEEMGLRLPGPRAAAEAVAAAVPANGAAAVVAPVKKAAAVVVPAQKQPVKAAKATGRRPAKKAPPASGRQYRQSPPVDELERVWVQVGYSQNGMARHYAVPRHTIKSWLDRHRAAGHPFAVPNANANGKSPADGGHEQAALAVSFANGSEG